jgi:opacity protein-like surface antigen
MAKAACFGFDTDFNRMERPCREGETSNLNIGKVRLFIKGGAGSRTISYAEPDWQGGTFTGEDEVASFNLSVGLRNNLSARWFADFDIGGEFGGVGGVALSASLGYRIIPKLALYASAGVERLAYSSEFEFSNNHGWSFKREPESSLNLRLAPGIEYQITGRLAAYAEYIISKSNGVAPGYLNPDYLNSQRPHLGMRMFF